MPRVSNPQEVFDAMASHFKPEEAGAMSATVQFDLSGDGGGQWHAVLADGKLTVQPGPAAAPTTTIITSADNFLALVNGELKPMPAFMTGKVKVKGNVYLHLIKAINDKRFLIGNNRGGINGWVGANGIYGIATQIEP